MFWCYNVTVVVSINICVHELTRGMLNTYCFLRIWCVECGMLTAVIRHLFIRSSSILIFNSRTASLVFFLLFKSGSSVSNPHSKVMKLHFS
jgi:hypothetical protein